MNTRSRRTAGILIAATLTLVGCGGEDQTTPDVDTEADDQTLEGESDDDSSQTVTPSGVITIGFPLDVITWDPHGSNTGPMMQYLTPIYDTLIRRTADFELVPSLATEWGYADNDNLQFEMSLREDVTFPDGTPVDADVVVANLEHGRKSTGPYAPALSDITDVEALDDGRVRVTFSRPNPSFDLYMAGVMGMMIHPEHLDAGDLDQAPQGSGPYVLSDESEAGQRYVYEARDGYWDPEAFGPERIVFQVLSGSDARLNALRSGEVDMGIVFPEQADAAEGAGLTILSTPVNFYGLGLLDRDGETAEPLGDVNVRRALNYAVDREAIAAAVTFGYGEPSSQIWPPGSDGYSDEADARYPYDPERAEELLAEAGYPDGFTLPVLSEARFGTYVEALDGQLRQVGVELDIELTEAGLIEEWATGNHPAPMMVYGIEDEFQGMNLFLLPESAYNPFETTNEQLVELYEDAATATSGGERGTIYRETSEAITEEAWFLITHFQDSLYAVNSDRVSGVEAYARNSMPYFYGWTVVE